MSFKSSYKVYLHEKPLIKVSNRIVDQNYKDEKPNIFIENSEPIYYFSKMNGIKSDNTERRKQTESMKFNIRTKFDAMDV